VQRGADSVSWQLRARNDCGAMDRLRQILEHLSPSSRDVGTHVVLFSRVPSPGTTKTRLIPALGPEGAGEQLTDCTLITWPMPELRLCAVGSRFKRAILVATLTSIATAVITRRRFHQIEQCHYDDNLLCDRTTVMHSLSESRYLRSVASASAAIFTSHSQLAIV
jgi:hypothetical protein